MQLIQPGKGTQDTRRVARRTEIGEENWILVQSLADKRLIVTNRNPDGAETAELIHEALIQQWDRLKEWMESDRAFRTWQEALRSTIQQWENANRDESGLLRGIPLSQAEAWLAERAAELSRPEKQFIREGVSLRQRQERQRQLQQEQDLEKAHFS